MDLAPQVGLEQSRLIQTLARIHHHFATNTEKINWGSGSSLALTTSSEIAKTARIDISAVQKRYILCSPQRTCFSRAQLRRQRLRFEFSPLLVRNISNSWKLVIVERVIDWF
jgi:hypothetical protein